MHAFSFRTFNGTIESLRSTGALEFYTPRPQKEILKQSLVYSGPGISNNLPDWLKNLETVGSHTGKSAIENANTIDERKSKIVRNRFFDCYSSPHWRQMAIENTVFIDF